MTPVGCVIVNYEECRNPLAKPYEGQLWGGMEPLEVITARRKAIAKIRADLDIEDNELEVAERVWRRLAVPNTPVIDPRPRFKWPNRDGQLVNGSRQQTEALALLPEDGAKITREDFCSAINAKRQEPLTENAYITLLSRMRTAGLIETKLGFVRRKMGGADVS